MGRLSLRALQGFLAVSLLAQGAAAAPIDVTYNVTASLSSVNGCSACASGTPLAGTVTLRLPGGDLAVGGAIDLDGTVTLVSGELATTGDPLRLWVGPDFNDVTEITEVSLPSAQGFGGFSPLNLIGTGIQIEGSISPGSFLFADIVLQFPTDNATGFVSGTEVSRTLVPEPSLAALVAFGSLVGLRAARRRR